MAQGDAAFSRGDIMRRLRLIESELRQLRSARSLEAATIGEGGLRVKGGSVRSTTFDGDMPSGDPGTTGWALGSDRLALGGQFVTATAFFSDNDFAQGHEVTTSLTDQGSVTVVVPEWADEALVTAAAYGSARNATTVPDNFGILARIDGVSGAGHWSSASGDGFTAHCSAAFTRVLNVSNRTSFDCSARVATEVGPWAASQYNTADISVAVVFRAAG